MSQVQHLFSCVSPLRMSSDIYPGPDLSKKVRRSRNKHPDRAEREERVVSIYESADLALDSRINFQSQEGGK